ncbi:MAG TPA: DUF2786 domain-containing protein, partial [Jiangellaceae bacterium]|nr:DUF2786 domain-containing protein [Jiangellaceae bacterium]
TVPSPAGTITIGFATNVIAVAAELLARGDRRAARADAARLATDDDTRWSIVGRAADQVLHDTLTLLWRSGWQPADIHRAMDRLASGQVAALAVDAMAQEHHRHGPGAVHPRWADQLTRLGAHVWWEVTRPLLSQWARRHHVDRAAAVLAVVELRSVGTGLPVLPTLIPPPGARAGTGPASRTGSAPRSDDALLARVRALLAKAESTTYPAEAEALSAKAQELMSRHSIEQAMLDAHHHAETPTSARRLWIDAPYAGPKSLLIHEVAEANHCRSVSHGALGCVTVIGDESDLDAVELLATSLMVQATSAMLAAGSQVGVSGQSRTRSFRHSFLVAYATRIGQRLQAASQEQVASAGTALVPVLARRKEAVDSLFTTLFPRTSTRSWSPGNSAGWGAGIAAADAASLNRGGDRPGLRPGLLE